jgi:ATPase subunit of ABC transporter with duplicated ATPase domains
MLASSASSAATEGEPQKESAPDVDPIWSEQERQQLTHIATHQSVRSAQLMGKSVTPDPSHLDPTSNDFNLYKWMIAQVRKYESGILQPRKTGVIFKNLSVHGSGAEIQVQHTVHSLLTAPLRISGLGSRRQHHKTILYSFNGYVRRGEMLLVLGRPGAGCSTFLKSISADTAGLTLDAASEIHYDGIPQEIMIRQFKGEILYNQEVEKRE